ncbi:urea transporter 2-like [Portunus trituberculatus]|uniref:urea transporter 2-like n=1 Tax=Portunus trituberculatus TaxID=210409 RepID=UPI001E1D1EB6|nr:urea transporter 2-like [Portunus trituberculatus]
MNNRRHEQGAWWAGWVGHMPRVTSLLQERAWLSPWVVPKTINSILRAIGIVAFANSPLSGLLILAAMFVGNPDVGWACLLAGVIGVIFAKLLNQPEDLLNDGVVVFNGILVACISVAVFPSLSGHQVDSIFWGLLVVMLVVTAYIDKGLNALMAPSKLPALSIPFNIAAVLLLLSLRGSVGMTGTHTPNAVMEGNGSGDGNVNLTLGDENESLLQLEGNVSEINWLKVAEGTVLAAGQIYGVGTMDSSILVLLGFLVFSPLLTTFFLLGSIIGSTLGAVMSVAPYSEVYAGLWGYNAMLSAGGTVYFLHVTPSSTLAAVICATLAALTQAASLHVFSAMTVPVLSYPFNVATLLILAISKAPNPPLLWVTIKTFPEHHIFTHLKGHRREDSLDPEENHQEFPLSITNK